MVKLSCSRLFAGGVKLTFVKKIMRTIRLSFIAFLVSGALFAQQPEIFSTPDGAIGGFDPVAFFKEGKPIAGKKELSYNWNGAVWSFSSAENLAAFKATPEQYAPQYGGWCAYGVADGHKSPTQVETWTIVSNKLYFNYNANVKKRWMEKQGEYIEQAEKNWPKLKNN
jgi:YHS domain-containing protein